MVLAIVMVRQWRIFVFGCYFGFVTYRIDLQDHIANTYLLSYSLSVLASFSNTAFQVSLTH